MKRYLKRPYLGLLLFLLLAGCATLNQEPEETLIQTKEFTGVSAGKMASSPLYSKDTLWTPNESDIWALETALSPYLQTSNPALAPKLGRYRRQYWGITGAEGQPAIYANFFCDDHQMISRFDWQYNVVGMMDGGDCYFQTTFDVNTGAFIWLAVNGES